MNKGYVQVYTGDGKGKTTASLGLAIRAAGAGLKVFVVQFMKKGDYSEIKALERLSDQIIVEQYGIGNFIKEEPSVEEKNTAKKGYLKLVEILKAGNHDLVIAEEANVALKYGLITENELLNLMNIKPEHVELVITGRGATPAVIEHADLVTEMKPVKHYFDNGVMARVGIEK